VSAVESASENELLIVISIVLRDRVAESEREALVSPGVVPDAGAPLVVFWKRTR
jgi:hypothetical protein